jgi:NADH-ubiquinone oxidoreductase chain 2
MIILSLCLCILNINIVTKRIVFLILIYTAIIIGNPFINSEINIYNGLWVINNLSIIIIKIILLIGSTVLLIEDNRNNEEKWIIMLTSILGMICVISANDLISFFLSIELQSYSLYILATLPLKTINFKESGRSAGLKYFLLGSLASGFILLGTSLIYGLSGLTQFESLAIIGESKSIIGQMLIVVGLLFKISASPFHNWAPDVYDGVPTLVTSWIAIFPKIALIISLNYLILTFGINEQIKLLLLITSTISLLVGSLLGLVQYRMKRLLAYSSISHIGFLLLCIIISDFDCLIYYLIQYTITSITVFFIIESINVERISELKGGRFVTHNNLLAISLSACLFSLAGIPPFIGFIAKLQVFYNVINQGYYLSTLIAMISSIIACAYYLRIIKITQFDKEGKELIINIKKQSLSYIISITTLFVILFLWI